MRRHARTQTLLTGRSGRTRHEASNSIQSVIQSVAFQMQGAWWMQSNLAVHAKCINTRVARPAPAPAPPHPRAPALCAAVPFHTHSLPRVRHVTRPFNLPVWLPGPGVTMASPQ